MILVTASWSFPCKDITKWLFESGNNEGVEILDLDTDEIPEGVRQVPTLIVDGSAFVGEDDIRDFLSSLNWWNH
jgi:glutaredoxin